MSSSLSYLDLAKSFSRSADSYDLRGEFHRQLAQAAAELLSFTGKEFHSVLELGCHTGLQTQALLEFFSPEATLFLSDIHSGGFERLKKLPLPKRRHFLLARAQDIPFAPKSFDLLYAGALVQWLPKKEEVLKKLMTYLKPGGVLLFSQFLAPSLEPLLGAFLAAGEQNRFLALDNESEFEAQSSRLGATTSHILESKLDFSSLNALRAYIKDMGFGVSAKKQDPLSVPKYRIIKKYLDSHAKAQKGIYTLSLKAGVALIEK